MIGEVRTPTRKPGGVDVAMFVGEGAGGVDKDALAEAKRMTDAGVPRQDIWGRTGWFQWVDGKWRTEISDDQSGVPGLSDLKRKMKASPSFESTLSDTLEHPKLYDAYPDLARLPVVVKRPQMSPSGYQGTGVVADYDTNYDRISIYGLKDEPYTRDTLLHEAQHAISRREGFATFAPQVQEIIDADLKRYAAQKRHFDAFNKGVRGFDLDKAAQEAADADAASKQAESAWSSLPVKTRADIYQRTPGEIEARNVERRQSMTPEQRRQTPPWLTQDVPDEQVLVRRR